MDRYKEEWAEERVGGAFLIQLTMRRRRSRMSFVEEMRRRKLMAEMKMQSTL